MPYSAMALYPFILIKKKHLYKNPVLLNHEKIHLAQQLELLIVPFYVIYLLNYLINLLIYLSHRKAYREIIFEREAYHNEQNLSYPGKRKPFSFRKYVSAGSR